MRSTIRPALLVLAACDEPTVGVGAGIGDGPDDPCGEEVRSTLAFDEVAFDGQSGEVAMDLLAGPHVFEGTWFDGRDADVRIAVTEPSAEVHAIDYPDGDPACARRFTFEAVVWVESDDGAIAFGHDQQIVWSGPWRFHDMGISEELDVLDDDAIEDLDPDATSLVAWLRLAEPDSVDPSTGYLELAAPTPGSADGQEQRRTRVVD